MDLTNKFITYGHLDSEYKHELTFQSPMHLFNIATFAEF